MTAVTRDAIERLVLGTAALGLPYGLPRADGAAPVDDTAAVRVIHSALERGVVRFDTAPAYGEAERRVGLALRDRGIVWTKVGRHAGGLDGLLRDLDTSCERIARESVDLLQWHNWTREHADDAVFRELWKRLKSDGRVRALGATTYGPDDALAAVESGLFTLVQVEWNLLNQRVVETIREVAHARGVAIAVRSVLLQGALTDDDRTLPARPALHEGVRRARELARRLGVPLTHLALRAALDDPGIAFVLFGADRIEHVDDAIRIARADRNPAECADEIRSLDLRGDPACDPRFWG